MSFAQNNRCNAVCFCLYIPEFAVKRKLCLHAVVVGVCKDSHTLAAYRVREKIGRAKYLLEATDLSLAEIADTLGFYDVPYFCKVFKRITGVTPRGFLKSRQL